MTAERSQNQSNRSSAAAGESSNASKARIDTASIVVVGTSASIEATDVETESSEADAQSEDRHLVLVSLDDYRPGLTVRLVDRLPATTVVRLLRTPDGETVPVLTQPDEYAGYVARSTLEGGAVGTTTHLFAREQLETGAEYELVGDAQVFSTRLNLFRVTARRVDEE
ncbi:hypothetical protein C477_04249 [Haloterrigena salina JCM 13891]|uniref:Uncharacterized protein n=1 Tax=Haloterrigena salina JCM 13891 TaxID=1227488 RepID=M0CIZ2_9EURY|nr:hypothetical protein [Haloterrigena salina]ELZ22578.1 hypothetical protein C477_04249 [Haloterrigena salina JCM 13891]